MPHRHLATLGALAALLACFLDCSSTSAPGGTLSAGADAGGSAGNGGAAAGGGAGNVGASAGAPATSGSGGMMTAASGAPGSAGTAGSAGTPGVTNSEPSAGCGLPPTQALASYVKFSETVPGVEAKWQSRNYYVLLPTGYDPNRTYPTVFVGSGCGAAGNMGIPISQAAKENAIVVGLDPDPTAEGRPCFNSESYPDPEESYFNETLKQVEAKFCVDKRHLFVEGFSSGSWLTNLIGCVDGDLIRGQGNASGCMQGAHPTCKGPIAFMGVHDVGDPSNSYQCGSENRDRIVKLNGCSSQTMPYDSGPNIAVKAPATVSCVQYVGCKPGYPVVWCSTTGLGHNDQVGTGLSTFGFWKFWMSLP